MPPSTPTNSRGSLLTPPRSNSRAEDEELSDPEQLYTATVEALESLLGPLDVSTRLRYVHRFLQHLREYDLPDTLDRKLRLLATSTATIRRKRAREARESESEEPLKRRKADTLQLLPGVQHEDVFRAVEDFEDDLVQNAFLNMYRVPAMARLQRAIRKYSSNLSWEGVRLPATPSTTNPAFAESLEPIVSTMQKYVNHKAETLDGLSIYKIDNCYKIWLSWVQLQRTFGLETHEDHKVLYPLIERLRREGRYHFLTTNKSVLKDYILYRIAGITDVEAMIRDRAKGWEAGTKHEPQDLNRVFPWADVIATGHSAHVLEKHLGIGIWALVSRDVMKKCKPQRLERAAQIFCRTQPRFLDICTKVANVFVKPLLARTPLQTGCYEAFLKIDLSTARLDRGVIALFRMPIGEDSEDEGAEIVVDEIVTGEGS